MSQRVHELWAQAEELPDGSTDKTALIEESVRLADTANDEPLGYEARIKLINAATWSGDIDKSLVAFTWCLTKYRERPERRSSFDILWYFKWTALEAPRFAQLPRARITSLLDDMERCYEEHGASLRPVHQHRHYAAIELGDAADARTHYDRWWTSPRDQFADCDACEQTARVDFAAWQQHDEETVATAQQLFSSRRRCSEVPHRTYAVTLFPLLRMGRVDDALAAHRTGVRMLSGIDHNVAGDIATHIAFLAITNNVAAARALASRWMMRAAQHARAGTRAAFWSTIALLCARLLERGSRTWRLSLPPVFKDVTQVDGRVDVAALGEACAREAQKIAHAFDARNGNASFSTVLARIGASTKLAIDAPLRARKVTS